MPMYDREVVRQHSRVETIIPALLGEHAIEVGPELKVRCPWHEDKRPSLRISPDKQTWCCDPCQLGGDVFRFVERHQGCDFPTALRFLAERAGMTSLNAPTTNHGLGRLVAEYSYRDEHGAELYQSVRYDPKTFRQRRPDGRGGWIWKLEHVRRVCYRLPELKGREAVAIVEGEKDADRLWAVGIPATCNVGGAGKWREDYTAQLVAAGVKRVRVIPDRDGPGDDHAAAVARSCHAAGLDVRIVPLPDVPDKGDVSDYLKTRTKADLIAVLQAAPLYVPTAVPASPGTVEMTTYKHPVLVRLADVQPEAVTWLWPGRIAAGKLNILAGDPGLGKSWITLDLAARVSAGRPSPDGAAPAWDGADVILLSAEDGLADTIRPRLDALGADVAKIHHLAVLKAGEAERMIQLADIDMIEAAICEKGAKLLIIDPVSAYLGSTDSHRDAEVRGLLAPLGLVAERTGAAVLGVMHFAKSAQQKAIYRAIGSIAFVGAARSVLAVARDPDRDDRRLVVSVKASLCPEAPALAYALVDGRLVWEPDPVRDVDVDALLSGPAGDPHERREADTWLRELLAGGPMCSTDIETAAEAAGIARRTLFRAKGRLRIVAERIGGVTRGAGKWYWSLPAIKSATAEEPGIKSATSIEVAPLIENPANTLDFSASGIKSATLPRVAPLIDERGGVAPLIEDVEVHDL